MTRGTHGRQGPPPDPDALRRDRPSDGGNWVDLPADGRVGDPPPWPLSEPSGRELALWQGEWRRPQAVQWEVNGQEIEVAMYVRSLVAAEGSKATAAERTLVLRQQEYLGLSLPGMARNRWRIGAVPAPKRRAAAAGSSARSRLRVVNGGE